MRSRFPKAVATFFVGFSLMFTPNFSPFILYEILSSIGLENPNLFLVRLFKTVGLIIVIWSTWLILVELYSITKKSSP